MSTRSRKSRKKPAGADPRQSAEPGPPAIRRRRAETDKTARPAGGRSVAKGAETKKDESADARPGAEAERAFVESLVATGQAAPLDEEGKLPRGATHELLETEEGEPKAVRRRFSIF